MTIRVFQHYWQRPLALLAALEITLFLAAPCVALVLGLDGVDAGLRAPNSVFGAALLFASVMFLCMAAMGLYNSRQRSRLPGLLARVAASVLAGAMVTAVVFYLIPALRVERAALLFSVALAFAGSAVLRIVFDKVVSDDLFKRRILIYGAGRRALSIARLRRRADRRGFVPVGFVEAAGDDPRAISDEQKLHSVKSLRELCERHEVDEIVIAMDDRRRSFPTEQLLDCRLSGYEIIDLVSFLERETGKLQLDVLNPSWMIFSEGFRQGRVHGLLERIFDVLASLILLAVSLPLMLLTALAIKLTDGPSARVFYGQSRVGQYGRPFRLLKFRSMHKDAERDGPQFATKNDSRVSRIGTFIRKTRIDELPQIVNVLRGEMSFVGPRPERPEFVEKLGGSIPYYRERHTIKPGITGWAQLCYPYGSSEQDAVEKLQYDLYYVKNHTLLFYLAILVQTVEVVLWTHSAEQTRRSGSRDAQ